MKIIKDDPAGWFVPNSTAFALFFEKVEEDWAFISTRISSVHQCKLGYVAFIDGNDWMTLNPFTEAGNTIFGVEPGNVWCVVELSL